MAISNPVANVFDLKTGSYWIVVDDPRYYPFATNLKLSKGDQNHNFFLIPKEEAYGIAFLLNYDDSKRHYDLKLYARNNLNQECEVSPQNKFCGNARYDRQVFNSQKFESVRIERKHLTEIKYKTTIEYSNSNPSRLLKSRTLNSLQKLLAKIEKWQWSEINTENPFHETGGTVHYYFDPDKNLEYY